MRPIDPGMAEKVVVRPSKAAVAGFLVALSQLGVSRDLLSAALAGISEYPDRDWGVRRRWQRQPEPVGGMLAAYWQARTTAEQDRRPVYVVSKRPSQLNWTVDLIVQPWPRSSDAEDFERVMKQLDELLGEKPQRRKSR